MIEFKTESEENMVFKLIARMGLALVAFGAAVTTGLLTGDSAYSASVGNKIRSLGALWGI